MNTKKTRWCQDEGGVDFIQLVIGLLIISIASVGTISALFQGYEQLDYQMRYRKAISIARSYAEYWQGRIHTDMPKTSSAAYRAIKAGNLGTPEKVLLDERDPTDPSDDIYARLAYLPLREVDQATTGDGVDFWELEVRVEWYEPGEDPDEGGHRPRPHTVQFYATMVPASY